MNCDTEKELNNLRSELEREKARADKAEAWNERFVGEVTMLTKQRDRLAGLLGRICDAWSDEDWEMDVAGLRATKEARKALAEVKS